jgi:hypothetical protein
MRRLVAAVLLAAGAAAEPPAAGPEPDAAVAEAARWVESRGCASGSHRSHALPVVTEIEEAWRLEFEAVEAPPVHWDGTGYVVAREKGKPHLVAFDLVTGRELARVVLRGFHAPSGLLVWDHMVLLQPDDEQITGYRLEGKKLVVAWLFRGRSGSGGVARPRQPVVHDNEIYCFLGDDLARVRPGASVPAWTAPAMPASGRPAVYGPFVFVAAFGPPVEGRLADRAETQLFADLYVRIHRRSNGERVAEEKLCGAFYSDRVDPDPRVTVTGPALYVGSGWPLLAAKGTATHVIVRLSVTESRVSTSGEPGLWTSLVAPAHHPTLGTLLLTPEEDRPGGGKGLEWDAGREGGFYMIAAEAEQPDLFRDRVTPTALGSVVYFGSWAADVETREILWRLPVKRVTCAPVPADGLVLVVDEGRAVRAFRGRGKR